MDLLGALGQLLGASKINSDIEVKAWPEKQDLYRRPRVNNRFSEGIGFDAVGRAARGVGNDLSAIIPPNGLRTRQQIRNAPFKMFEDQTFQGNPAQFQAQNPQYTFFEDNSFGVRPRTQQEIAGSPFKMFEDRTFQGNPRQFLQQNPGWTFYEDNSFAPPIQPEQDLVNRLRNITRLR